MAVDIPLYLLIPLLACAHLEAGQACAAAVMRLASCVVAADQVADEGGLAKSRLT